MQNNECHDYGMSYPNDDEVLPRFFKVLADGESCTKLLIPIKFARKYKHVLTEKSSLETEYNPHSWKVKIEERNEEEHYFTRGWPKFVKDNKLHLNYLVFELVRKSTFKVSIFNLNGCEEEFPSSPAAARETKVGSPRFSLELQEYNKYYVNIPIDFAVKARLAEKRGITLVDPSGDRWPVVVIEHDNSHRFQMRLGWNDFIAAQGLHVGSKILIRSMGGSKDDFLVEVLRKDTTREVLKAVDKRMGRLAKRRTR